MEPDVPEEMLLAIDELREARMTQYRARKAAEEVEYRRLQAISTIRRERYDDLYVNAKAVFEWRETFAETGVAYEIWGLLGSKTRLPIFGAKFWRGEPAPPDDRTVWATLAFEGWTAGAFGYPPFWYEERHKGRLSHQVRICHVHELVDKLHPEFLAQLHDHLNGPDAWQFIIKELKRRTTPKGT